MGLIGYNSFVSGNHFQPSLCMAGAYLRVAHIRKLRRKLSYVNRAADKCKNSKDSKSIFGLPSSYSRCCDTNIFINFPKIENKIKTELSHVTDNNYNKKWQCPAWSNWKLVESIGAMLRTFSWPALLARGFSASLLFCYMELDHPKSLIMSSTDS
jgi:hypothetical protein